jgi:hypothetical protein
VLTFCFCSSSTLASGWTGANQSTEESSNHFTVHPTVVEGTTTEQENAFKSTHSNFTSNDNLLDVDPVESTLEQVDIETTTKKSISEDYVEEHEITETTVDPLFDEMFRETSAVPVETSLGIMLDMSGP